MSTKIYISQQIFFTQNASNYQTNYKKKTHLAHFILLQCNVRVLEQTTRMQTLLMSMISKYVSNRCARVLLHQKNTGSLCTNTILDNQRVCGVCLQKTALAHPKLQKSANLEILHSLLVFAGCQMQQQTQNRT